MQALDVGHVEAAGLQRISRPQSPGGASSPIAFAAGQTVPEFRDANLKVIFEALSQAAGMNFIFDKDIRPNLKATLFVQGPNQIP